MGDAEAVAARFQERINQLAEYFVGQPITAFTKSYMTIGVKNAVVHLYADGGMLADENLMPIVDWNEVEVVCSFSGESAFVSVVRGVTNSMQVTLRIIDDILNEPIVREISAQTFMNATGRMPEQDDLDRANCPDAGKPGHYQCGWDFLRNKPRWECVRV